MFNLEMQSEIDRTDRPVIGRSVNTRHAVPVVPRISVPKPPSM